MPIVTVDPEKYERFELKTAPPDGYVMLRPLPYGMKLTRRSKATKMMMRSKPAPNKKQALEQDQIFELENMDELSIAFDFAYCIGEHNLMAADGNLIDFSTNTNMKIKMLDPKVGSEIERLIDELNNDEDEETMEDFLRRQSTSSEDSPRELSRVGNVDTTEKVTS